MTEKQALEVLHLRQIKMLSLNDDIQQLCAEATEAKRVHYDVLMEIRDLALPVLMYRINNKVYKDAAKDLTDAIILLLNSELEHQKFIRGLFEKGVL